MLCLSVQLSHSELWPLLPAVPNLDFPVASFEVLPTPPYPLRLPVGSRTNSTGTFGSFLETPSLGPTPGLRNQNCTLGVQAVRVHVPVGQPWTPHDAALTHRPAPRCCSAPLCGSLRGAGPLFLHSIPASFPPRAWPFGNSTPNP